MNRTQLIPGHDGDEHTNTTELQRALRRELVALPFHAFERCIGSVLKAMGYRSFHIRRDSKGRNRDGGWDIDATFPTGLTELRAIGQVKQYDVRPVQKRYVDELRGCMLRTGAGHGILVTLSTCSNPAKLAAAQGSMAPIRLIEGDELIQIMIAHGIGVTRYSTGRSAIARSYFARLGREYSRTTVPTKTAAAEDSRSADDTSITVVVSASRPLRLVWKKHP